MKKTCLISFHLNRSARTIVSRFFAYAVLATGLGTGVATAQLAVNDGTIDQTPAERSQILPEESASKPVPVLQPVNPETEVFLSNDVALPDAETSVPIVDGKTIAVRPPVRVPHIPRTRWQHMEGHSVWTRAALSALKSHGSPLIDMVPGDITNWCPAYADNDDAKRRAFWVGYMSALAKHESTYKPWAVGGGGKWYGLLQILPATARGYKCNVGTGEALKNGAANLSCGVRIMAFTVKRDGVIHGRDNKWRGVSADWGPMRSASKRRDMAGWLKRQNYCTLTNSVRPRTRP
ncbi:MAG: transglycosylase SLT domain-containing protein [Sulfitobacter sp.]